MNDFGYTIKLQNKLERKALLLSIVDGLIGTLLLAAILVMSAGILYMMH